LKKAKDPGKTSARGQGRKEKGEKARTAAVGQNCKEGVLRDYSQ